MTTARERLLQYLTESKAPRTRIATGLGISPGYLSQYLNAKFPGNVAKMDEAVEGFLERVAEKAESVRTSPAAGFAMTRGAQICYDVLRECHIDGDMGAIISSSGLGKTTAIHHYTQENTDVLLVTARPTANIKVLLVQIAERLRINSVVGNDLLARSISKMLFGTGKLIVVDEAQYLTTICLETFRYIHDEAGVGLVFSGMPALYQVISKEEHLFSRLGSVEVLPRLEEKDVRQILEAMGVQAGDPAFKNLLKLCDGSGRRLEKLIKKASRLSEGKEVTVGAIGVAAKKLKIA